MKDYRIDKKGDYITTISSNTLSDGTETFDVKFADGRIFKNVLCNKNNLQKIVEQQDKQAEEGIELLPVLKKKLTSQGIIAGCTGILSGISGCEIVHSIQTDESIVIPLTVGILTITALMLEIIPTIKNKLAIKELEKIQYKEENRHDLRAYIYYPNSLVGVNEKTKAILIDAKNHKLDPFYTINIDCFSKKDMEKIVENIKTERNYQFTYKPKSYSKVEKD